MLWQYTIAMTREFIITQAKSTIMVIAKKGTERKKIWIYMGLGNKNLCLKSDRQRLYGDAMGTLSGRYWSVQCCHATGALFAG